SIAIVGQRAYLACLANGIVIVNLSNPAAPVIEKVVAAHSAHDITISGNNAFVADGTSGVSWYDITDPASPRLVSTQATKASAAGVAIGGASIYVANTADLEIIRSAPIPPSINAALISLAATSET